MTWDLGTLETLAGKEADAWMVRTMEACAKHLDEAHIAGTTPRILHVSRHTYACMVVLCRAKVKRMSWRRQKIAVKKELARIAIEVDQSIAWDNA